MRDFFCSVKASALFVGTVIGAGFATGEEIKAYFCGANLITVIISALIFATSSGIFLFSGKVKELSFPRWLKVVGKTCKIFCVFISLFAMVTAAEEIFFYVLKLHGGGLLTTILCWLLVQKRREGIGIVNLLIVPVIIIFVVVVLFKNEGFDTSGNLKIIPAFLYACMNLFGAGMMMREEGSKMSVKQILWSAVLSFLAVGLLMVAVRIIVEHGIGSMPLLQVAKNRGVGLLACIVIYLAIFTTLLSDIAILLPDIKKMIKKDKLSVCPLIMTSLLANFFDFSFVVQTFYPIIGICGVFYLGYAIRLTFGVFSQFFLNKCDYGVHSSG